MGSAADGGHGAAGLVTIPEGVLAGFDGQGVQEQFAQRFVVRLPQGGVQVDFVVMAQAGAESAVGCQTHFVAGIAEMGLGHGADEADEGTGADEPVILGGAMAEPGLGGGYQFIVVPEAVHDFFDREKVFGGQNVTRGQGHQFNEAQRQLMFGTESDEGPDLLLVDVPHENSVEFDALETGADRGMDAFQDGREVSTGDAPVELRVEGVQTDVDGAQAGLAQGTRHGGELDSVGGQTDALDARDAGHLPDQLDQAGSEQRLATRKTELPEPEAGGDPDDPKQVMVGESLPGSDPAGVLTGSAVNAAFVASVGDRDAQIIDGSSKGVHGSDVPGPAAVLPDFVALEDPRRCRRRWPNLNPIGNGYKCALALRPGGASGAEIGPVEL